MLQYKAISGACLTPYILPCSFIMRGSGTLRFGKGCVATTGRQQKQRCVAPKAVIAEPPALSNNARNSNGSAKPLTREGPTIMNGQVGGQLAISVRMQALSAG
jgi:hypothetical protein